jgi:hypothetical protein
MGLLRPAVSVTGGWVSEAESASADFFSITTFPVLFAVIRTPSTSSSHSRGMRRNATMLGDDPGAERDPGRGSTGPDP